MNNELPGNPVLQASLGVNHATQNAQTYQKFVFLSGE